MDRGVSCPIGRKCRATFLLPLLFALAAGTSVSAQGVATISAESGSGLPGSTISLSVTLFTDVPAAAFSYGLRLDSAVATPTNLQLPPLLADINGGAGPDFLILDPFTTFSGFAFGVILDFFGGPDGSIPGNTLHTITTFDVVIDAAAPSGVTAIELRDDLSDPGFVPIDLIASDVAGVDMITTGVAGALEVLALPSFLRGDVNQNGAVTLSDATLLLAQLFQGVPMPCPAAADFDGSGSTLIDDAIAIVGFLFDSGAPPPPPYPLCGTPASPSPLPCGNSGCP